MLKTDGNSAVCTLFEGDYHHGVAVLINSLYRRGYRGDIYAGYRGELPGWCSEAKSSMVCGPGSQSLEVAGGLRIHLMPLVTDYHLTNYKPDFMLNVWDGPAQHSSRLYYFDPDIVVCGPWGFFQEWVDYGVALCEDINSPLPENHPRRASWRRYFGKAGIRLSFRTETYVNGGYVGLTYADKDFLRLWKDIQELMAPAIGGLSCAGLPGAPTNQANAGPYSPFGKTDQDALNATIEAWPGRVSIVGQEGMSIKAGATLMPHALGHPKPWKANPLLQAISGRPPRIADREYWQNARGVVTSHGSAVISRMRLSTKVASFIGRFYTRR